MRRVQSISEILISPFAQAWGIPVLTNSPIDPAKYTSWTIDRRASNAKFAGLGVTLCLPP